MSVTWNGEYGAPGDPTFAEIDKLIVEVARLRTQLLVVTTQALNVALGSAADRSEARAYITEAREAIEQLGDLAVQVRAFR